MKKNKVKLNIPLTGKAMFAIDKSFYALIAAGWRPSELKAAGWTPSDLKAAGWTSSELIAAGWTPSDLKAAGWTPSDLKAAGWTPSDLIAAGWTPSELKAAGWTPSELKATGWTPSDLIAAGWTPSALIAAGWTPSDLKAAGWTLSDLKAAGWTSSELIAAGWTPSALKAAGWTSSELIGIDKIFDDIPIIDKPYSRLWKDIQTKQRCHQQSTFGPDNPSDNICGTPMCTAGHLVNMAGSAGYALKRAVGWSNAAAFIHQKVHPNIPHQNFQSIPQDFALEYIKQMAEYEDSL